MKTRFTEDRNKFIGASEIGALVVPNKYSTPHKLWLVKTGRSEVEETLAMRMGKAIEPFILREGVKKAKEQGYKIRKVKANKKTFLHKSSVLGATPDAFGEIFINGAWHTCTVETKFANDYVADQFGQEGSDQCPNGYVCQVAVQLLCTGMEYGLLFALLSNRNIGVFLITADGSEAGQETKELQRLCAIEANRFWVNHVRKDLPPKVTGYEADTSWVKEEYSYDDGSMTNTDYEHSELAKELIETDQKITDLELKRCQCKNLLISYAGSASVIETPYGTFTNKADKNGRRSFRLPKAATL